MSEFKELIKSFPKTREYVRDFFVYGFKTREEFKGKSPRTYDNERRRLESWLGPYVRKDQVSEGANISLAIDSSLLDTNPLYQVWKTKSFTDNDVVLHFLILDLLQDDTALTASALTAEEITDALAEEYEVIFDLQTVRRKCNAYEKEGLLQSRKEGKKRLYYSDLSLYHLLKDTEEILEALEFYQLCAPFGIIGDEILEQMDAANTLFRVKHCFFVHTLEEEILLELLQAMRAYQRITVTTKSTKSELIQKESCIPLKIFVSTKSGRRYLCAYEEQRKRFHCYRLDAIKKVQIQGSISDYEELQNRLERNLEHVWGVSFDGHSGHMQKLQMLLSVQEPWEHYIVERLEREGRGGTVTQVAENTYQYEIQVFDCNEMLPWIRTFIGRILSLKCSDPWIEQRFKRDLETMYRMYEIHEDKKRG